jgi:hypothetical protein
MAVVLSNPEEMKGKTVAWVSTGSKVVNIGFTDNTCYSIKLKEAEWNAQEHLMRVEKNSHLSDVVGEVPAQKHG